MRRVGNRIQLAVKHWKRQARTMELFRFRQRWAQKFNEYECVGGPLDGHTRRCLAHSILPTDHGYYEIDRGDCRLHYKTGARVSSWGSGL